MTSERHDNVHEREGRVGFMSWEAFFMLIYNNKCPLRAPVVVFSGQTKASVTPNGGFVSNQLLWKTTQP